ncbi:MAG: hypothetical protein ABI671_02910 [Burkholderiales bacterium]
MVSPARRKHLSNGANGPSARFLIGRPLLMSLVALSLIGGVAGGLWRLGLAAPSTVDSAWLGRAALDHAPLMICGFLGTVISLERAVAVKLRWAFAAPLAAGAAGACMLLGAAQAGKWLAVIAALVFVAVSIVIVRRQRVDHTVLLLVAAVAWLIGGLLSLAGQASALVLPWWFSFLVVTVAAERLEMTRLMRRRPTAQRSLHLVLVAMLLGAGLSAFMPVIGGLVYGASLTLLALWLAVFDIARRTLHSHGLSRYMALCLLGGYFWLALAGLAWAATALGFAARYAALHALGLGFIVSMIMGHAPVILPAVARIKLRFTPFFFVPLLALHLSLVLRLGLGAFEHSMRSAGAALNVAAIMVFAATVVGAAWSHRAHDNQTDLRS